MFSIGEKVVYGANGVYTVEDIRDEELCGEIKKYYILSLFSQNRQDKVFVPLDNERLVSKMKKILSQDEIFSLVRSVPSEPMKWIPETRARNERFKEILTRAERAELVHLAKTICLQKEKMISQGKRLFQSDENTLMRIEKILYDEFSLVLDISRDDILSFIINENL